MSVLESEAWKTKCYLVGIAALCIAVLINATRSEVSEGRTETHLPQQQEQVRYQ